jgi:hypothetical protein
MCDYLKASVLRRFKRFSLSLRGQEDSDEFIVYLMRKEGFTEEEIRSVINPPPPQKDPEKTRARVIELEAQLMDAHDADAIVKELYSDTLQFLQWRHKCKNVNKETVAEIWKTLTARKERALTMLKAPLVKFEKLKTKCGEWMRDMETLHGTHYPDGQDRRPLETRHDARQGVYGRGVLSTEDCDNKNRTVLVMHGHGGWYRTGLVSRCQLDDQLPGLVCLNGLLRIINEKRVGATLDPIVLDTVDLAFVDHHGVPIMLDKVIHGAYPNCVPLSPIIREKVGTLIREAEEKRQQPETYLDTKCRKQYRNEQGKVPAGYQGFRVAKSPEDKAIWDSYQRMKKTTSDDQPGQYVDIIHGGGPEGEVMFPELRLGALFNFDQGVKEMKPYECDHYKLYTLQEELLDCVETTTSASMSCALIYALTRLKVETGRRIRIIWAGCRSEQWPKNFTYDMFGQWIKDGAEARRAAVKKFMSARQQQVEKLKLEEDCLSKPLQSAAIMSCNEPPLTTVRVTELLTSISAPVKNESAFHETEGKGKEVLRTCIMCDENEGVSNFSCTEESCGRRFFVCQTCLNDYFEKRGQRENRCGDHI